MRFLIIVGSLGVHGVWSRFSLVRMRNATLGLNEEP